MKKISNFLVPSILIISACLFTLGVIKKIRHLKNPIEKPVIAVIPVATIDIWWSSVNDGATKAASEAGYQILWTGPEIPTDRERQIQLVDDALIRNVKAVVLAPNDTKALIRPAEKVMEKKIPCIIIDAMLEGEGYDAFIGTDNYEGGVNGARALGKACGGHGKVILMKYIQNSGSTFLREQGFKDTLAKEFPDMTIGAELFSNGTAEDARQKTADMLTRCGDAVGVFALNQTSSIGAYMAIHNSKFAGKIHFVAFDSDPILVEGMENKEVDAIVVQNPYEIGYQGVRLALKKINGEQFLKKSMIPSMLVEPQNLEEMKKTHPSSLGL